MDGHWKKPRRDTAVHRQVWGLQDRNKREHRNEGKACAPSWASQGADIPGKPLLGHAPLNFTCLDVIF